MDDLATKGRRDAGPDVADALRMLLVNEPHAYRETLAATLQSLQPETRVMSVEPEMLGRQMRSFAPHLVIARRLGPDDRQTLWTWVELYPAHGPLSWVGADGRASSVAGVELGDLLSLFDRVEIAIEKPKQTRERRTC